MLHGSEESVVQADRLHELAFSLEESIAGFNLDGSKLPKRSAPPPSTTSDPTRSLPPGSRPAKRPAAS
jgi:hypothetical protein